MYLSTNGPDLYLDSSAFIASPVFVCLEMPFRSWDAGLLEFEFLDRFNAYDLLHEMKPKGDKRFFF